MNKEEVQQRVLQNGKPLALNKFEWDKETKTFSSSEDNLIIDFSEINDCTFDAGSGCIFKTGPKCAIINRNVFEVILPNESDIIQICPTKIAGHLINGKYKKEPHIIADGILSKIIKL